MQIIGIDLGTTNSLCTCWQNGKAALIPNALGKFMTPSVVGLDNQHEIIIGETAKYRMQTHPDLTIANFKRYMGTNKTLTLGKKKFRPEELSSLVLRSLKADAEAYLKNEVTHSVISVPAYFSDAQRKATKTAGKLAGLTVDRLINEPTAAAMAYGLHQAEEEQNFLVFDIGGGTFDVSILEYFDGVMQVNASAGDNFLGGEDFLLILAKTFASEHKLNIDKLNNKERANLMLAAEKCKIELSSEKVASMAMHYKKKIIEMKITRDKFNDLSAGLLTRLRKPLERALKDAKQSIDELDTIVLVGGTSRMPIIRSLASKMLGKIPAMQVNPDEVVALGTAVLAGMISKDENLKEVVLTDVAPYTLGVGVVNEVSGALDGLLFHPIIERNSPVPISKSDPLYTASDNQNRINIGIYQGESRLVKDNILLGELSMPVPLGKAGEERIDVRFTYDINGLLEVESKVMSTKVQKSIIIEGNPGVMTAEEISKRLRELAQLKIHPRQKAENALILARGEKLYEESLGEMREYIGSILSQFEQLLNKQNEEEISEAIIDITKIFDDIESSPLN